MTPEAQRIAIAEACGWKWFKLHPQSDGQHRYRLLLHPDLVASIESYQPADMTKPVCNLFYLWSEGLIPDYLNSLDAMHEAEKVLTPGQKMTYRRWISGGNCMFHEHAERVCHATAAQRAEAFLRTLSLYHP